MECLLYVLVECESAEQQAQLHLNLSVDKPVLEEDVDTQWHRLFSALEFVPLPEHVLSDGLRTLIAWPARGWEDPGRDVKALAAAGIPVLGALEAFEDGGYCSMQLADQGQVVERGQNGSSEQVFFDPSVVMRMLFERSADTVLRQ